MPLTERYGCPTHPDAEYAYDLINGNICTKCGERIRLLEVEF
jgi:hypothetical protein